MSQASSCSFDESLFSDRYQRNNKKLGLKNLRCFPTCGNHHSERGFCGRSIVLTVCHQPLQKFVSFACFSEIDAPLPFAIGQTTSLAELQAQSRSKDEPMLPWISSLASYAVPSLTVFEFNRERKGWHCAFLLLA